MPIDPKQYKPDPRSPQELAKAILNHELMPRTDDSYSLSFREQLLMDYETPHQIEHPVLGQFASKLLWTLKALEEGLPCDANRKRAIRHALHVTGAYQREAAEWRDDDARDATETGGPHAEAHRREAADSMETWMVEIGNLRAIDKLIRALAHKLGVSLVEPCRGK